MTPEAYRKNRRQIYQMKRQLIEHQHSHDPEHLEFEWEDIEELERSLNDAAED